MSLSSPASLCGIETPGGESSSGDRLSKSHVPVSFSLPVANYPRERIISVK